MIVVEDLTKQFDDFVAVQGVHFNVAAGQVLALLGPNGAGKTTTVRMLTSILRPTRGRATVAGFDVVTQARQVRASVGVLTEQHGLYGRMNAAEYLDFYRQLYGVDRQSANRRIRELLERFDLASAGKKRLGEYSKGMRQKLALVRAMLHNPPVLLLDEPTSAMDPESARVVRDAIHGLRDHDVTIVLCTHNLVEAEELADMVAIIRRGHIIYDGSVGGLKRTLLGPLEYEARLADPAPDWLPESLPEGVILSARGEDWLRFRVALPHTTNPILLKQMMTGGLQVISFHEVTQSLEMAYLEAVSKFTEETAL
jgi:ABC-2 type transport system ATP-binding protein